MPLFGLLCRRDRRTTADVLNPFHAVSGRNVKSTQRDPQEKFIRQCASSLRSFASTDLVGALSVHSPFLIPMLIARFISKIDSRRLPRCVTWCGRPDTTMRTKRVISADLTRTKPRDMRIVSTHYDWQEYR